MRRALEPLALLVRMLGVSVRAQMQYRTSFLLLSLGQLGVTAIEFAGVWALFDRFGRLPHWTLAEVAVFYGVVNVAFALADAVSRGFDLFGEQVKRGGFDRVLLRPRGTVLQIAGSELALHRVGRLAQGVAILLWGAASLGLRPGPLELAIGTAAVAGGAALFFGLVVLQATLAFWSTESLELLNTLTYGGVQTAQYPLSIYRPGFRRFFLFVVPLGCVAYLPVVALLGREDPLGSPRWLQLVAPLAGFAFLAASLAVWRAGVRHYTSTGS